MVRIKIVKPNNKYPVGEILTLDNNEAFGLLDSGVAIVTKDMTGKDYKTRKGKG